MMTFLRQSLPFVALLALAGPAVAAPVVATPPLPSGISGVNVALCEATNLGKKPATITVEIVNAGTNVAVNAVTPVVVDPGRAVTATFGGFVPNSYCRVTGLARTKTAITFLHLNNTTPVLLVTAP